MSDRPAIELLEEAVALARSAPARAWTWYLAGAVPFFAALLFYFSATTGALTVPDPAVAAFPLALLFGWRQLTRSIFGRVLAEEVSGIHLPIPRSAWLNAIARTWFAGLLRILIPLPVPWLTSLFRNHQAYAWTEHKPFARAAAIAGRGANPLISWLTLGAIGFFVWLNIFMGILSGPFLYRMFTGEETALTRDLSSLASRAVIVGAILVAWCLCDAVIEALYVLRRFYGESEQTGADLLRAWRKAISTTALMLCIASGLHAAPPPDLNKAIDEVLTQPQYHWREAPPPAGQESALVRWIRSVVDSITHFILGILHAIGRLWDAFWRWLFPDDKGKKPTGPGAPASALRIASVVGLVVLAGALIALLLRARSRRTLSLTGTPPSVPVPVDLNDPSVVATDLPEEQWLALARQWMEKGDARMALRAWFLACLALLGGRDLLSISRYKSNLDYRRELARRARSIPGLDREFAASVNSFETAWYGLTPSSASDVESFAAGFERIRGLCK